MRRKNHLEILPDRREFLCISAAAGGLFLPHAVRAAERDSKTKAKSGHEEPQLRVLMTEADGSPLIKDRAMTLCARDLANDPLPQHIVHAEGRARVTLATEPIQLSLRFKVPGFGEIYCWADNDGKGFTKPGNINFVVDAATTRLRRVREAYALAKRESATIDLQTEKQLQDAVRPVTDVRTAYAALAAGLHAGEQIRWPGPQPDFATDATAQELFLWRHDQRLRPTRPKIRITCPPAIQFCDNELVHLER